MSNTGMSTQKPETLEIEQSQWVPFLATFTRENRGAHARLEVVGPDVGSQIETGDRPFEGVAADVRKSDEPAVWITLGANREDRMMHGIHNVQVIRALPADGERGATLEVEVTDGTKTILELSLPDEYALLPGDGEERKS
jgi:hypothetical protein